MGGGLLLLIPGIWTDIAGLVILVVLTLLMRAKRSHMQKAA